MSGDKALDEQYIRARKVLLDALDALEDHLDAITLVGAQAIYLHTGEAQFAVAQLTTDADLALNPKILGSVPVLETALEHAGFERQQDPGMWLSKAMGARVDLLVPEALAGKGTRSADIPGHGKNVAHRAQGLEGTLVDRAKHHITAFEESDPRAFDMYVAGPAALLIAKLYKISERPVGSRRSRPKDSYDTYCLLQLELPVLRDGFARLRSDVSTREVAERGISLLAELFGSEAASGSQMAAEAIGPLGSHDEVVASCAALAQELLETLS
ncbi:MAG TPA: GSU2403 family nucleotidyltransferase fold protein [Terriglobales bacterium]|nr:GSU2403 family nucleotidyltransferase fold protein [Terriglobales bacterium]